MVPTRNFRIKNKFAAKQTQNTAISAASLISVRSRNINIMVASPRGMSSSWKYWKRI